MFLKCILYSQQKIQFTYVLDFPCLKNLKLYKLYKLLSILYVCMYDVCSISFLTGFPSAMYVFTELGCVGL